MQIMAIAKCTKYDYLIVGAGLYGSVFARQMTDAGYRCLVVDRREHIAGNCFTKNIESVNVHMYGPHIFHTSSKKIWEYVQQFADFNRYTHAVAANYRGQLYSLPFNMWTFNKFWGVKKPEEAKKIIDSQKFVGKPSNLEEQALSMVGKDVYEKLIKDYTSKQWRTDPKFLPPSIIKRIPIRYTYDTNYFDDTYQGIPIGGYTELFKNLLDGIDVEIGVKFEKSRHENLAKIVVFTGPIDEYYDFEYGKLEYRPLKFEHITLDTENFQGIATVNYTDIDTAYTRIVEHKHFENTNSSKTVITKEYPINWTGKEDPYYPMSDEKNTALYNKYKMIDRYSDKIIFGGRLAEYRYYDMHQVIGSALSTVEKRLST